MKSQSKQQEALNTIANENEEYRRMIVKICEERGIDIPDPN